jgi:biotin transport system substrate-specific component
MLNMRALSRSRASALGILGCTALMVLGAQWAVPLPFTPVPVTWQVAAVLFAGLTLGARGALASLSLYLAIGLAGAPVFAQWHAGPATILGPTGGYLLAMPVAAWLVGRIAGQNARDPKHMVAACLAGLGVVYTVGVAWLALTAHLGFAAALVAGAGWFLFWDIAKALIVIVLVRGGASRIQNRGRNG